jgi:hypothetical protein
MMEYQKETRKKFIQNQYRLKSLLQVLKEGLKSIDMSEEKKTGIENKIKYIEENGEYQDILKIVETSKLESYKEFKELLEANKEGQNSVRLEDLQNIKKMDQEELEKNLVLLNEQLKEIEKSRKEYVDLDRSVDDLEATHVILSGSSRTSILLMMKYYDFHIRYDEGVSVHPGTVEILNEVNYRVENNLPVRREVVRG